jgi:DNA-binding NarL/FixJ family response regulator
MMNSPIRLIIADDHAVFRQGLMSLLQVQDDMVVAGEADRADGVLPAVSGGACDVLMLGWTCRWIAGWARKSKSWPG